MLKKVLYYIVYFAAVIAAAVLVVTFVGQRIVVSGTSMSPTLADGENLIVNKIVYRFSSPERYDIIVFPDEYNPSDYYVKRIVGLPGESVQIKNGYIYIDGEKLNEDYGIEVMQEPGCAIEPIKLHEDEYFVLGDNRNHSADSRDLSIGPVELDQIIGRVEFVDE